ncbi:hypothetical protein CPB84DRAFT_1854351 [Gymnopilus junonius]|uniref:Uncharacterized protein n=1 Tax=Gymnopilus junonius TaxID=109634 RepID=A0A9P5TFW7_GYMJU|nr:hypothetical protein CPB84DRAFT_1854351 [Gymnopilus junonius]
MLTNVETFGLHSARWTHWHELGPDAQSGIMQIITRPCCVELHLENVRNIVPSLLNSCRSLKIWEIGGCFLEGFEDRQSSTEQMEVDVPNDHCIYLDSVSFNTASPELLFDLDPCSSNSPLLLRFSHLRHLTITMSPETIEAMWKLIHCASDTLRTLTLRQRAETSDSTSSVSGSDSEFIYRHAPLTMGRKSQILRDPHISLAPMTHLHRFSLTVILQVIAEDFPRDRLYDWCVLLRTSPPSIREVNITLDLFYCQPEEIIVIFSPSSSSEDGTDTFGGTSS